MIIYEMWSVGDDVHWMEENEETQTGASLLLIFCYWHIVSYLLYNIEAAAVHG
jgi:hypothetical protein